VQRTSKRFLENPRRSFASTDIYTCFLYFCLRYMRRVLALTSPILLGLTAGCTTITITTLDGSPPHVERAFGRVSLYVPSARDNATVVSTGGFGAARTPTGFTIGYWNEKLVILSDASSCRTVVWVEDQGHFESIIESIQKSDRDYQSLCIVNGEKK
jgi:hypothetical protein